MYIIAPSFVTLRTRLPVASRQSECPRRSVVNSYRYAQVEILAGNSGASVLPLTAWATVTCGETAGAGAGAVETEGGAARVTLAVPELPPHTPLVPVATLTLDCKRTNATGTRIDLMRVR